MKKPVRKAVFPVAGLGTRFLPATKAIPKEMLTVVDKPLIQYAVEEARAAGIEYFILVTSRGKSAMEDHFDYSFELNVTLERREKKELLDIARSVEIPSGQLAFARQSEPLGLGHAIWCAREFIGDEPFAVILPDELVLHERPCLAQMMEAYNETGGNMVSVFDVPRDQTHRYGILDIGRDQGRLCEVKGLVEKPKPENAPSTLSLQGRYILQPDVLKHLGRHEKGAGGEIQLTDAMARLIGHQPFHGFRFEGKRFDCGDKLGFIQANVAFALNRPDLSEKVRAAIRELL
ncbi:MAG: UTP--glucose-1-phosphate uridylyltransferase GalU [Pseudomonadota bacterium]|nr:UTP--glucose-1-phosphate uridylyltransferase GalU [Pseudomonadota bacterium]